MKRKLPTPVKDGIIGAAMGASAIVPGISGGTIAFGCGVFQKIIDALGVLFSKKFFKSLLVLLPFLIGAAAAILALVKPFQLAFEYCLFAIVCLFVGLIIGSLPGVTDEIKTESFNSKRIIILILGFLFAAIIGVLSVFTKANVAIDSLFIQKNWFFYPILICVGFLGAMGFIIPGFSGSMLLMVIGFYQPVLNLFSFDNFWPNVPSLLCLALGAACGIVICSKILSKLFAKFRVETIIAVIGFIIGSIISIFINGNMFDYFKNGFNKLDVILAPILLVLGVAISYILVRVQRHINGDKNA